MEKQNAHETVETSPVTIEPIVSAGTPDRSNQEIASPRMKNIGKHFRTALFSALAAAGAFGAYKLTQSHGHNAHHGEASASEHDSSADEKSTAHSENNRLKLDYLKGKAEEALTHITFAERDGNTDKLRECLAAMERWQQEEIKANGEPEFREDNGLVPRQTTADETLKQDLWVRVEKAKAHYMPQVLDKPELSDNNVVDTSAKE